MCTTRNSEGTWFWNGSNALGAEGVECVKRARNHHVVVVGELGAAVVAPLENDRPVAIDDVECIHQSGTTFFLL